LSSVAESSEDIPGKPAVILEFCDAESPVIIRTRGGGVKIVAPIRPFRKASSNE
jgi:hypothetical protein